MTPDAERPAPPRRLWLDALLLALLVAVAAIVRCSHLWLIPQLTDEMREVNGAWKISPPGPARW